MQQKEDTIQEHYKRISKVLSYIECKLYKQFTLVELADISNFGKRHFQRIMKAHLNEPIGAYITKKRIETAAKLIMYSKEQLSDIAYKMGYSEIASFSKSFKKYFGVSPNEFRKETIECYNQLILKQSKKSKAMELKEKIVNLDKKKVIFCQKVGYYNSQMPKEAWDILMNFVEKQQLSIDNAEFFGINHDDAEITESEKCRYDACITINTDLKPEGQIGVKEIPGGKYAVFPYIGPYENLDEVYNAIFGNWFAKSGVELAETPILERYLNDPKETKPEDLLTEIYVPLK